MNHRIVIPFSILLLMLCIPVIAVAQDVPGTQYPQDTTVTTQLVITDEVEASITDSLRLRVTQLENLLAQREDSLAQTLLRLNDALERQQELEEHVKHGDINTLILMRTYLKYPYSEERYNEAIKRLDMVTTPSLEKDKEEFRKLFEGYRDYYDSVMAVLKAAAGDRALRSPFKGVETAKGYIGQLKQTDYYRDVYRKSFYIPYLNELIDTAIARFNANNPSANKEITLTDLINPDKK